MWNRSRSRNVARRGNNRNRGGVSHDFRGRYIRGGFSRGGNRSRGGFIDKPIKPLMSKTGGNVRFDRIPRTLIERLSEEDIGVTEYVSSLEGFKGILKARYSDFQVNEIDKDGNITKLTDLSVPVDPEPEPTEEDDEDLVNRYRIEQLPIETWDKLHRMVQSNDRSEVVEIDVTETSKADRTKIHEAARTVFGAKIVGSTITKNDKKFIVFKKFNKNDKIDLREKWPATRGGEYVYFLVHKEFTDTIEANIQISDCLQMRPCSFCYAGVKDRRAKTTQWFCARKVDPAKIVERTKNLKNIFIGNFCYKKETLKLGQLQGNRFRIAIREITANKEMIEKGLESLKNNGFINYYGLQRFGNSKEIPTHTIGIKLLNGNWEEAVNLILKPRKFEQFNDIANAKLTYAETGDASLAFSKLKSNRNKSIEGKLLNGLAKHDKKDFVNALENVPRNMRLLYIHAYQSMVWNLMTSKRIKEFGLKPIVGDIVVEDERQKNNEVWESVETDLTDDPEVQKDVKEQQIKVKVLSETDLSKYSIYDIVLPLPGYDITYPGNVIKDWYKDFLERDGLSLEMPKQKVKTYTLSGAYRKIVERVSNMSWKFMDYNDPKDTLIRSDIEELKGLPEPQTVENGKFKALVLDFCLSSACYATMALRELLKINTSWDGQEIQTTNRKNEADIKKETLSENEKETTNKNETNIDIKNAVLTLEKIEDNKKNNEIDENEDIKPKLDTRNIPVVTQEEIQQAKEEFIQKEIEELEDEIWSIVESENVKLANCKRKNDNLNDTDAKKLKKNE